MDTKDIEDKPRNDAPTNRRSETSSSTSTKSRWTGEPLDSSSFSSSSSSGRSRRSVDVDDLTRPPSMPSSSTHSKMDRKGAAVFDSLTEKSPFRTMRTKKERVETDDATSPAGENADPDAPPRADFATLKQSMPSMGWAQAHRAASSSASSSSTATSSSTSSSRQSSSRWTDENFLTLFPHLRLVKSQLSNLHDPHAISLPSSQASPEEVSRNIHELRQRFPELEQLHFQTTLIKVLKWRELLGARKVGEEKTNSGESNDSSSSSSSLPSGYPSNTLHPRYHQPDIFLTPEEVGNILLRCRELLYISIENIVTSRLRIIRAHLPGINLATVLNKYPGLLLIDLQVVLPMKLQELRAVFPEVNLVHLIEKDATILSHAVSSYLIPRLNLLVDITKYEPEHVLTSLVGGEHTHILSRRWNRFKRIEIVRDQRFWEWWKAQQQQQQQNGASETPSVTSEVESSNQVDTLPGVNDPSSLPFSLYADLIAMTQEEWSATFPWFELQYSEAEQVLFERQAKKKYKVEDGDDTKKSTNTSNDSNQVDEFANLTPSILSRIPGHPLPLASALGLSSSSTLTPDEARAQRRMEYLKLKETKAYKREHERSFMQQREREHQRRKMEEYTQKFQAVRAKGGLTTSYEEEEEGAQDGQTGGENRSTNRWASSASDGYASRSFDRSTSNFGSTSSSSSSSSFSRPRSSSSLRSYDRHDRSSSSRDRSNHQKNRAGHAASSRHAAHSYGRIEPNHYSEPTPRSDRKASARTPFGAAFVASLGGRQGAGGQGGSSEGFGQGR